MSHHLRIFTEKFPKKFTKKLWKKREKLTRKKKAIFCLVILLSKVISSMASKVNFQDKEKNRRIFPNFWGEKKEEWNDSKFMPHLWPHHSASLTFCGHLTKTFLGVLSNSFKLQLNYALHEFLLFVPKMKRGPFFLRLQRTLYKHLLAVLLVSLWVKLTQKA